MQYNIGNDFVLVIINEPILEEAHMKDLIDKVAYFIKQGKVKLIIDMTQLKSLDGHVLGILISCLLKARRNGGEIILANIPENINDLLGITHLIPMFIIAKSVEEAKTKFKSSNDMV